MKTRMAMIAAALLLTLTGCMDVEQVPTKEGNTEVKVSDDLSFYNDLPDGRRVLCISYNGGLQCDWDHATVNIGEDK